MIKQEVLDQETGQAPAKISWGNFAIVVVTILLLLGVTFIKKPELFSTKQKKILCRGLCQHANLLCL